MKPLIVGEAPSKNENPPTPIAGRIGRRLAACAGLTFEEFLEQFDRVNLLQYRQEIAGKGFQFDMLNARMAAHKLSDDFVARPVTLLLGKRVADAFRLPYDFFVAQHVCGGLVYVVPHPSGVSRWWNDFENCVDMAEFMRRIVSEHVQGALR